MSPKFFVLSPQTILKILLLGIFVSSVKASLAAPVPFSEEQPVKKDQPSKIRGDQFWLIQHMQGPILIKRTKDQTYSLQTQVYSIETVDGMLSDIDKDIRDAMEKSDKAIKKLEAEGHKELKSAVKKAREDLSAEIKTSETNLLKAINTLDQRILNDEIIKNLREQIKAEVLAELMAAKEKHK